MAISAAHCSASRQDNLRWLARWLNHKELTRHDGDPGRCASLCVWNNEGTLLGFVSVAKPKVEGVALRIVVHAW